MTKLQKKSYEFANCEFEPCTFEQLNPTTPSAE